MTKPTIETRVKRVIAEQFGLDINSLTDAQTLDSLGADSLDTFELLMGFEEEFDFANLEDDEWLQVKTVGEAVKFMGNKVAVIDHA